MIKVGDVYYDPYGDLVKVTEIVFNGYTKKTVYQVEFLECKRKGGGTAYLENQLSEARPTSIEGIPQWLADMWLNK